MLRSAARPSADPGVALKEEERRGLARVACRRADGPESTTRAGSGVASKPGAVGAPQAAVQLLRASRWRARRRAGSRLAICSAKLLKATSPY